MEKSLGDQLVGLAGSPYIWAAVIAYIAGQALKYLLQYKKGRHPVWRDFFSSGNMPSTHAASTVALATVVGFGNGFDSVIFAVTLMFAAVVCYDATHVRRAVGEHGLVLRELIDRDHDQEKLLAGLSAELLDRGERKVKKGRVKIVKPYFSRGHLPREVMAGTILGVFIGVIVSVLWRLI